MRTAILTIFFVFLYNLMFSQNAREKKASEFFNEFNYTKTISLLENQNDLSAESLRLLAFSYFKLADYENSEKYFEILTQKPEKTNKDLRGYLNVLLINRKYTQAIQIAAKIKQSAPGDISANLFLNDTAYYHQLLEKHPIVISNLPFNTDDDDFAPVLWKDKLIFTSSRFSGKSKVVLNPENYLPLFNLWEVDTGSFSRISALNVNSQWNQGTATVSKDGSVMIYAANHKLPGKDRSFNLQLLQTTYENNKWQNPQPLNINNKDYSVAQPFLTADGQTLYFVSNMPGGFGGMDIYKCEKQSDGTWGTPVNLGNKINTEGNEAYPYLSKDGLLFFASDGHPGLGGLDIFVAKYLDGEVLYVENLGAPVNSNYDDFALFFDSTTVTGYFSSNRPQGKGSDDIYSVKFDYPYFNKTALFVKIFDTQGNKINNVNLKINGNSFVVENGEFVHIAAKNENIEITASKEGFKNKTKNISADGKDKIDLDIMLMPALFVAGTVKDLENDLPLPGVDVKIIDNQGNEMGVKTNNSGHYEIGVNSRILTLVFENPGYKSLTKQIEIPADNGNFVLDISLSALAPKSLFVYFDFNRSELKLAEIDKLSSFVEKYKDKPVKITLTGHTDSKGSENYNKILSLRRAREVKKYLSRQMPEARFVVEGKGKKVAIVVDEAVHSQYLFLPVGQKLTPEFISTLPTSQQEVANSLNRRVEINVTEL